MPINYIKQDKNKLEETTIHSEAKEKRSKRKEKTMPEGKRKGEEGNERTKAEETTRITALSIGLPIK